MILKLLLHKQVTDSTTTQTIRIWCFAFVVLCIASRANCVIGQGTREIVAHTGQYPPGYPAGAAFDGFNLESLSESGQIVFNANIVGSNVYPYWLGRPGELISLPLSGGQFQHRPSLNASGEVAIQIDNPIDDQGIWLGPPGNLTHVAKRNEPAPGTQGALFGPFRSDTFTASFRLTDSGQLLLRARLFGNGVDASNDRGLWIGPPDALSLIVRQGQAAPGLPAGNVFYRLTGNYAIRSAQDVVFEALLAGPQISDANRTSIWRGNNLGELNLVARAGDPAPGLEPNVGFSSVVFQSIIDSQRVLVRTTLVGPGISSTNDTALWVGQPGNFSLIARKGDPAPGLTNGVTFASITNGATANGLGQVAFIAKLNGPGIDEQNNETIWYGTIGNLSLVAREGDQVPNAAAGVIFNSVSFIDCFDAFHLNSHGVLTFQSAVSGPAISEDNDHQVFRLNGNELKSLGTFDGDLRFNDAGQIAVRTYDTSSGYWAIELFTPESVPEPASIGLVVIGMATIANRRFRVLLRVCRMSCLEP